MIQRDPRYYMTGHIGEDPYTAPFYLRSLVFDGKEGDFNTHLVDSFNSFIEKSDLFSDRRLATDTPGNLPPGKIIVINASHDDLPTAYETVRIFEQLCSERGWKTPVIAINTREELMNEVNEDPASTLVVSQCVDKNVYNVSLAEELEKKGVVIVPGKVTAPGSVFSDKDSTYKLFSDDGKDWGKIARYKKIPEEGKSVKEVVNDIFTAVDELQGETGDDTFFVKPHEGGGGLGGFRITKTDKGYIIPDLSKVSGDASEIQPTYIDLDVSDEAKLRELLWIYRLFASDERMTTNYLRLDLPIEGADDATALRILREYLEGCAEKRRKKLAEMVMKPQEAEEKLISAIQVFEDKFKRRYTPLVNEHIDFGLWGLRAHYRLSSKGPRLETVYHRIFQLGFTEEGIGYLGADNISNKQTGELEILRLGPINKIMLAAIGGEKTLNEILLKGAESLVSLAKLLPEEEKNRIPVRLQLDLATVTQRIGEGNADTARGMCLASRWTEFVRNTRGWLEDSLMYYAWKKKQT
ncbi:MAG: hypothetical protein ACE5JK_05385 [Candidatus Omnitrophota bacterium]